MGESATAFLERMRATDPAELAVLERQVATMAPRHECRTCDGARWLREPVREFASHGTNLSGGQPAFNRAVPCPDCGEEREPPERLLARSGLGRMAGWSFETYPGPGEAARAVEAWALEVVEGGADSLVIAGATGRGKTGLAAAAVRLLCERGVPARFLAADDLLDGIRARFGQDGAVERYTAGLRAVAVLVIDDLARPPVPRDSEWAEGQLTALVDARLRAGRPTVVTLDVSPRALAEKFGQRLASRLREYRTVRVEGDDLRGRGW